MKKSFAVFSAAATLALPFFLLAPGTTTKRHSAPFMGRYFAHRGLHNRDKSVPENSLEAFRLAAKEGYGIELDVRLTRDGKVVVFHDDTLERMCGVNARVDEKSYDELKALGLAGSCHRIPLFTDVLDVVKGRGPIIVEIKDGKKNRELCEKTYKILSNYTGDVCIESFNPFIVAWFRIHGRDLVRGQLACPITEYPADMKFATKFILANCLMNFLARPQFIAYRIGCRPLSVRLSEAMGAMKFGWTSHDPKDKKGRDGVIFEFYKPELKFK